MTCIGRGMFAGVCGLFLDWSYIPRLVVFYLGRSVDL